MDRVVNHWSANMAVLAVCAVVVAVHLKGMLATAADARRDGRPRREGAASQATAFYAGIAVVLLALVTPVGYWSQHFIWIHSLQDLLLAVVAPGLIVLGAPWLVLARGAGRRPGQRGPAAPAGEAPASRPATGAGGWGSGPWASRHRKLPVGPVAAVVAFNVAWWVWHAPLLYDGALRDPLVYAGEVVTYLGLGILFWLQLIGSWPWRPRSTPLQRVTLIAVTIVSDTLLGMVLGFGATVVYPFYSGVPGRHISVVTDQQVGGAVLWVLIMPPLLITAVALLIRWLKNEESESEALTAGLGRLLESPTSAWPSRSGLR